MRSMFGAVAAALTLVSALAAGARAQATAPGSTSPTTASASTAPATTTAAAGSQSDWTPIFRSDDPLIWDTAAGDPSKPNGFAVPLASVPPGMKFLRLKRMDTGETIMMPVVTRELSLWVSHGDLMWSGMGAVEKQGENASRLLGIGRRSALVGGRGQVVVLSRGTRGNRGWGFARALRGDGAQLYTWDGKRIPKTVFEIAVKSAPLTEEENKQYLTVSAGALGPVAEGDVADPGAGRAPAPPAGTAKIARRQSSIRCLVVSTDESGLMLGSTIDLILTGTPGPARDDTPVTYVTTVGEQMKLVLDDVLRNVRIKYPKWEASKVELSFDDRTSSKDGSSIGAAAGTLILSMLEGYEVDPKLAMTGNVTAEGRVRPIGGVAAKVRGATGAGCTIVAVPADNYAQLVDAYVYEGAGLVTKIQVVGIGTLEDAQAVARTDRADKLKQAMELFAEVQQTLQKSPDLLKTKATRDKLGQVAELAPNHYSAKLLLLAAQDKAPRRLSATASLYYTAVAMNRMLPVLTEQAKAKDRSQVTPTAIAEGLKSLDKVRRIADPTVVPLVDAWREFVRAVGDAQAGRVPLQHLEAKAKALENAAAKLNANRDVMEKMVREGV